MLAWTASPRSGPPLPIRLCIYLVTLDDERAKAALCSTSPLQEVRATMTITDSERPAEAHDASDARHATLLPAVGASFFPIALVARFPYAMMVVGVLTLVVAGRGSLGIGGLTSAMVGIGTAIFGPLIGSAADRFGQRLVVMLAGLASSLALLTMSWVVYSPLPDAAVLAAAFVIGATTPQVPPMSRSRLVGIIARRIVPERRTAVTTSTMAYESAVDELTFVFGPMIVGLLAATMSPAAPVIGAAVLTLIFVTAFALHSSVHEVPSNRSAGVVAAPARELLRPGLVVVLVGVLGIGLFFGSLLTALTSAMSDAGHAESAGLVYGVMGIGSAAFALGSALFPAGFTLHARWIVFPLIMVVGTAALLVVEAMPLLLVVLLVLGIGLGPTLVVVYSIASDRSPRGRGATVMTMATTGIVVGQSAASAINGHIAETAGTQAALLAPLAAASLITAAGLVNRVMVARARSAGAEG